MTLMDLITADPGSAPVATGTSTSSPTQSTTASHRFPGSHSSTSLASFTGRSMLGDRKSKRATLMQIQNDTISAAKAALKPVKANVIPHKQSKKPISYSQLARSIHELAATSDQKSSQKQLVFNVFPKLAVYNSVDPSLAPSLLMLNQQCENKTVLRYVYYYLARILSDTGVPWLSPGGGIPTPNWDALATIDSAGGVTRADVVPRIVEQLLADASNTDIEFHARRLQALKALTYAPLNDTVIVSRLFEIIFDILEKVASSPEKRKKGVFAIKSSDVEFIVRSNLQYAALSALRRLPLDPGNPMFLNYAVQGILFSDPVAVRFALDILCELANNDPFSVAVSLGKHVQSGGAVQDILHLHDVLARVSLARLCHTIAMAPSLDERPDIKSQFSLVLHQLLLDPSERVCFEAIFRMLGKYGSAERLDERAAGWYHLTREILKLPEASSTSLKGSSALEANDATSAPKHKSRKTRRPQLLIRLVLRRLESSFRSFSRPVLHAAARVVLEMGKSRAAAFSLGIHDFDESTNENAFSETTDSIDSDVVESPYADGVHMSSSSVMEMDTISGLLASIMEVVRSTVACECVYVRAMVIKALIWMHMPYESYDELASIIALELSDPDWTAALVNDILLTLHARFKVSPDMAVTLLEIARIFATKVPGKIDADVLQLLWKTCLVAVGPTGKHTALEAVTIVLDLPPPQPGAIFGLSSVDRIYASDPKSALALQRLVQAAVWFLGENANYAASEYAWESVTPPGTALMMLDTDKMVAAANSRNSTLAGALTRLQRCAFSGSWEVRIIAVQALTTIAIRSGEPFRLQIYEFLNALAQGGVHSQLTEWHLSNGEDQGSSGTGLGALINPMIKILDEMYGAQDELMKEIRNHDNTNHEWTDEELKDLYCIHERLLDIVSLFCFVPRAKYLPLGPISAKLIDKYRTKHNIIPSAGLHDLAVTSGISDLICESKPKSQSHDALDNDLFNAWAASLGDDELLDSSATAMDRVKEFISGLGTDAPDVEDEGVISRTSVSYDDMWAKTLLESSELEEDDVRSPGVSSPDSGGSVETAASSHFGGMGYPSLFGSRSPAYGVSQASMRESSENPTRKSSSNSSEFQYKERVSFKNPQLGKALYDFTAGGDDELNITAGEELEIEYEVDGWFHVKKKRPGRDGKRSGLVPVLYVNQS